MNTTRRGLGGLLAGAVAATQTPYRPQDQFGKVQNLTDAVPINAMAMDIPERLQYLLNQRGQNYLDHYTKRDRYAEARDGDVDVLALRSCSAAGRDVIFRTRQAKQRVVSHAEYLQHEIDELLKRNPLLRALI